MSLKIRPFRVPTGGPLARSAATATAEGPELGPALEAADEAPQEEWVADDDWDVASPNGVGLGGERYQVVEGLQGHDDSNDVDGVVASVQSAVLRPRNHSHELPLPSVVASSNTWTPSVASEAQLDVETARQFELLRVNYTSLLADLDMDMRAGRGLPRIVDKALWLFDLKQVVQEIESSVMSKVSCTACKAGVYFSYFYNILFLILHSDL